MHLSLFPLTSFHYWPYRAPGAPEGHVFLQSSQSTFLYIDTIRRSWHFLQLHWHFYLFAQYTCPVCLNFSDPLFPTTCSISLSATISLTSQIYHVQNLVSHTTLLPHRNLLPQHFTSPFLSKA